MKLKPYLWILFVFIALSISVLPGYSQHIVSGHQWFQASTLGALSVGVYDGTETIGELKQHGNFGLGTFEGLDGEMIVIDHEVYQITMDGAVHSVVDKMKTPFATVTFFQKERSLRLPERMTYQELQQRINQQLPIQNLPYAIRIAGIFPYLKVRSVPKQTPPYPPLNTVVSQQQAIFELRNVRGTLVGFRMPPYLRGVNVAGYHFHFITSDRKAGGHLLDGEFLNSTIDVETLRDWQVSLPDNAAFEQASLE